MVPHGGVEGEVAVGAEGGGAEGVADGQGARPQRALHGGVGPQVHLHPHLPGDGPAQPRRQAGVHLGQQGLQLGPPVAVQVVGGQRAEGPAQDRADAPALALLPAGLFRRRVPAAARGEAAPEALVRAEGGIDKALHDSSHTRKSVPAASPPHLYLPWRAAANCC